MSESRAQPATEFGPEEEPTRPSAPSPEDLAMQAWLADARRDIRPLGSATSRFRAVAVVALDGGVGRVSQVDALEAEAPAVHESGTRPKAVLPAKEVAVAAPPVVEAEGAERALLGPRGTVRIVARAERGPTGTVLMPAQARKRATQEDTRRATRFRRMFVVGIAVLCGLDIGWVALSDPPQHPSATVVTTAVQPAQSEPAVTGGSATAVPAATTNGVEVDPAATMVPAERPAAAAARPGSRVFTPPSKQGDAKRKRGTPAASVF
jgi:hypothetical protein